MRSFNQKKMRAARYQRGFTLIEILIAIVVLAVGLLGLAGLQLQTLRYSTSAGMRTIATTQAASVVEKILANRIGLTAGNYNNNTDTGASTAACFTAAGCTPAKLAALDLLMWKQSNAAALPDGDGVVCIDSTPADGTSRLAPACDNVTGAPYAVKIWWSDDRTADAARNTARFVTSFQP